MFLHCDTQGSKERKKRGHDRTVARNKQETGPVHENRNETLLLAIFLANRMSNPRAPGRRILYHHRVCDMPYFFGKCGPNRC